MRIAFTHNLRLSDSEDEAEFDSAETVDAIAAGLRAGGHEVEKIEVTGAASRLAERIESFSPDLIFNTAEGRRGRHVEELALASRLEQQRRQVAGRGDLARAVGGVVEGVDAGGEGRLALADAAQAHRDLESRSTTGSLVLLP